MIGWLKKRLGLGEPEKAPDPLAGFDQRLQVLTRRTSELRRSAATLLSLRGDLERGIEQAKAQADEARRKASDPAAERIRSVLEDDAERAQQRAVELQAELERVRVEAAALSETVQSLEREAEQVRRERASAVARHTANQAMLDTGGERARVEGLIALERARDEAEKAQALAELAREDAEARKAKG